jgi:hypothetical protein
VSPLNVFILEAYTQGKSQSENSYKHTFSSQHLGSNGCLQLKNDSRVSGSNFMLAANARQHEHAPS